MSISTSLAKAAIAALTVGAVVSFAIGPATANTLPHRGGATHPAFATGKGLHKAGYNASHNRNPAANCYYLPTVSNGSVSGLEKHCSH